MVEHLKNVLETNSWLDSWQFGFVAGHCTEDALNCLVRVMHGSSRRYMVSLFLDISRAFDNAHWSQILDGIAAAGYDGKMLSLFRSYISNRQA